MGSEIQMFLFRESQSFNDLSGNPKVPLPPPAADLQPALSYHRGEPIFFAPRGAQPIASAPCISVEPALLPLSAVRSASFRRDADDATVVVRRQHAFGLIQQNQFVAEGVANARASPDRDVERTLHSLAARAQENGKRLVNIFNQNIGFRTDVQVSHELCVRLRKGKADRFVASPQDSMPEAVAIERYRRIKIGDAKQKVVELSKQGPVDAHA